MNMSAVLAWDLDVVFDLSILQERSTKTRRMEIQEHLFIEAARDIRAERAALSSRLDSPRRWCHC